MAVKELLCLGDIHKSRQDNTRRGPLENAFRIYNLHEVVVGPKGSLQDANNLVASHKRVPNSSVCCSACRSNYNRLDGRWPNRLVRKNVDPGIPYDNEIQSCNRSRRHDSQLLRRRHVSLARLTIQRTTAATIVPQSQYSNLGY